MNMIITILEENKVDSSNEVLNKYMQEYIDKLFDDNREFLSKKIEAFQSDVLENPQYVRVINYCSDIKNDFIFALQLMSIYSTRTEFYKDSLTIFMIDEILESLVGMDILLQQGIHNTCRRELRYLLELVVKLTIIDINNAKLSINDKLVYLKNSVPNSSIDYIDELKLPFNDSENKQFVNEIKDLFKKLSAYIHPSAKQLNERLNRYKKGNTIGFESFTMLEVFSKELFRIYDILLVLMLYGFGQSISSDLFIYGFDSYEKWKFHKGKYVTLYSKLFDYKYERKTDQI